MEKTIKQEILVDPILEDKTRKTFERISENLHILANDPSLAFYRLQENTRRSMPRIIERRVEAEKLQHELQGNCYDIEYAIDQINTMKSTVPTFKHILELAKAVVSLRQKLTYLKNKRTKNDSSMYKRLSAHITLDLPELPDAIRETATKVESTVESVLK